MSDLGKALKALGGEEIRIFQGSKEANIEIDSRGIIIFEVGLEALVLTRTQSKEKIFIVRLKFILFLKLVCERKHFLHFGFHQILCAF